jgi:hypothetical protein
MTVRRKSLVLCFFFYLDVSLSVISDSEIISLYFAKFHQTTFISECGDFLFLDS